MMLIHSGYGEEPCEAMPKDEASVAPMAGQESPSSVVFDSPSGGAIQSSSMPEPYQISLHLPVQPAPVAPGRPGKTSAGPPALIPDVTQNSNFSMPSGCTFHTGCDSRLSVNNNKRSRSASASRRRKSTRAATTLSTCSSMPPTGHCNPEHLQQHRNLILEQLQHNHPHLHGLQHPDTRQQQLGRFMVTPLTGGNTGVDPPGMAMDMETNC